MTDLNKNCIALNGSPQELARLLQVLEDYLPRVIACSGGIDSLLLATLCHRMAPGQTVIAHAVSPAVPDAATERVANWARQEEWSLEMVRSGEFDSEDYLSNPVNRCYYCKSNLYTSLEQLSGVTPRGTTLMSGANTDDLGEYRPGLIAAGEHGVVHPYIEAKVDKGTIRRIARYLGLPFAELPASPCLASRLYTGTRVTSERLGAVEAGEELIRQRTTIDVVRCRVKDREMLIEVPDRDRDHITDDLLEAVMTAAGERGLVLHRVQLDPQPYRAGRAFVATS